MKEKSKLVPLTLAHRWWGLAPETLRSWAIQDGATLWPSAWGAAIGRRELRETLARRSVPIPPALEEWPRVLVAVEGMEALKVVFDTLDEAYPDATARLATDGAQALRELEDFRPHLLLADMTAPRFDPTELCRQARFCPATPSTRIVALGADQEQAVLLLKAGHAACLPRLFKAEELADSCARLLSGQEQTAGDSPTGLARLFAWR